MRWILSTLLPTFERYWLQPVILLWLVAQNAAFALGSDDECPCRRNFHRKLAIAISFGGHNWRSQMAKIEKSRIIRSLPLKKTSILLSCRIHASLRRIYTFSCRIHASLRRIYAFSCNTYAFLCRVYTFLGRLSIRRCPLCSMSRLVVTG